MHAYEHRSRSRFPAAIGPARRMAPSLLLVTAVGLCLSQQLYAADVPAGPQAGVVTIGSLLSEMTDLAGMAEFPNPAYTYKQFSSYDRASKTPSEPIGWFGNHDQGNFIRIEERAGKKDYVMMDVDGPGTIVRIWIAKPVDETAPVSLRIFLDGADAPAIDTTMQEILRGNYPGLPRPIAGAYSSGWNLYLPIPYAKHCKVTSDDKELFYHVDYRTYAPGTKVATFTRAQLTALDGELKALAARLTAPGEQNAPPAGAKATPFDVRLAPGASLPLGTFAGASAIRRFRLQWTPSTADRDEIALRGIVLEMTFDGETTVATPLGDFFGAAPGINPFDSLPLSVAKDGRMDCRWVMPFRKSARITATNHGKTAVSLKGDFVAAPYAWTNASMYFHAKWRMENDVPTSPWHDWNYMTAKGKGVFAGAAFTIQNPNRLWWGEGDDKIFVDGEAFPSVFGTGSEDFYGFGYCSTELFTHAYHSQARCDGPNNYGRTSLNRFQILDRLPFTKDFRFDFEIEHWTDCKVNLTATNYWYAMPGATDGFKPIAAADVALRPTVPYKAFQVSGAIEGEAMKVIQKTGTTETPELWVFSGVSGERYLHWGGDKKVGDALVLGFNVPAAGTYRVFGHFIRGTGYGIVQFAVNGQKAGEPLDFFGPLDGQPSDEIELGTFALSAGENRLTATIVGANASAKKNYLVGIDYLIPKPAKQPTGR